MNGRTAKFLRLVAAIQKAHYRTLKRLRIDRKHNDKDDTKTRVDVAFASGLAQGLRGGREEAEQEFYAEKRTLQRRVLDLERSNAAMARERNNNREAMMDLQQELGEANKKLDAAVALLKQAQLASTNLGTTLFKNGYTFQNGVLIHESTARAAENERTLEDDLDSVLAGAFADQEGTPQVTLTAGVDPNVDLVSTPIRYTHIDEAPGPDQTAGSETQAR